MLIMGSRSSNTSQAMGRPRLTERPTDITELNAAVWELYAPTGKPDVEIVFFHGLQAFGDYREAFWKTWLSEDGSEIWPKVWLSQTCPRARILTISYDSSAQTTATTDMYNLGENLCGNLVLNSRANVGQNCPVILVGHSLGGLAIKQFILSSQKKRDGMNGKIREKSPDDFKRVDSFLRNFSGVFYYGTPHAGSRLADYATWFSWLTWKSTGPIFNVLRTLNTEAGRLNSQFEGFRENYTIKACTIGESRPTKRWVFNAVVVPEASGRQGTDGYSTEDADHFGVCKPKNKRAIGFQALDDFICNCVPQLEHRPLDDLEEASLIA